jgi:hypothetical protein
MVPNNTQQFGSTDSANFSMDNNSPKKHGYRMILITGVVILIAIGGYLVSRNENLQQVIKNTVPSSNSPSQDSVASSYVPQPASVVTNRELPWVEIVQADETAVSQNQPFTVTVRASSGGKDIAGYDVLLAIDPSQFEIQSIASELESFSILQFEKGTHVTVTGIKNLGQNEPTVFSETPILSVTLKPIKKGAATISVLLQQDKEQTILVDTDVVPVTPQVGSLSVEVQ